MSGFCSYKYEWEDKLLKAKKAHERRWHRLPSALPLEVLAERAKNRVKITDLETGNWTLWDLSAWRIRLLEESNLS